MATTVSETVKVVTTVRAAATVTTTVSETVQVTTAIRAEVEI